MSLSEHVTDLPPGLEPNGESADLASARAAVAAAMVDENQMIETLQRSVKARTALVEILRAEIAQVEAELKRDRRMLGLLTGETPGPGGPRPNAGRPPNGDDAKRSRGVGDERLAEMEAAIRKLAAERDEFRQVDVRQLVDVSSSVTALAFEHLRQNGMIRLARKQGNNKYYRLTNQALQASES